MNYIYVKPKKKNTALVVVSCILALILVGGALAGIGYAFDWWNAPAEETPAEPSVPMSSYNLDITSLKDLEGISFNKNDFSSVMSSYDMTVEELIAQGALKEGQTKEDLAHNYENIFSILNVNSFGKDFAVKSGIYNVTFTFNGTEYKVENVAINGDYTDTLFVFQAMLVDDEVVYLTGDKIDAETGENSWIIIGLSGGLLTGDFEAGEKGYTLMLSTMDMPELERFEFVSFEKVGELELEEEAAA